MPANILLLRHPLSHIGKYSGYENFVDHLQDDTLHFTDHHRTRAVRRTDIKRRFFLRRADKKLVNKPGLYYNAFSYMAEMEAFKIANAQNVKLIHNTFLEDNHGFLGNRKTAGGFKLVATAHQPYSWWKYTHKPTTVLDQLDALFVLSNAEAACFETALPGRVHVVRHGVSTDFFTLSKPVTQRKKRILFVGNWLRDTAFFAEAIETLLKIDASIAVDIVYRSSADVNTDPVFRLCKYQQVTMHQHISNEALRDLYNDARLLFLPLTDATANNAILEAAACGVPVVTTNLPSLKEYTNSHYAYYYNGMKDCVEYIIQTIDDEARLSFMSREARVFMEQQFAAPLIAKQHIALYKSFL
ncbi:glycosyltransferase family 4 protein [Panacibacter sp. DH6]|uniref:Glycosyltransferase family 4 protein n=1 Tax=Panacibacter microcysteis TaxID=2793269 RepID=A0A931E8M0_9BACT|nr:glycosyltransferase family 4 protein [Panacibacter microcysteis]MBG9377138.1 glycosyltransferase family 4 protein [Panacibacter microcysteis]